MDSTELLRALYDQRPAPDAARLHAMRAPLELRLHAAPSGRPQRAASRRISRRSVLIGAGLASTGLVVAGIGVAVPAASASAAEVLHQAARYAARSSRAGGAGTVMETRTRSLETYQPNSPDGPRVAIWNTHRTLLRSPKDGEAWLRLSASLSLEYAYGDRSLLRAALAEPRADAAHPQVTSSQSGAFVNNPTPPARAPFGEYPSSYRALPRDPSALLEALKSARSGAGSGTGWAVLQTVRDVLGSGVADAGLQVALFRALRQMPDLAIVDGHARDLDGRDAVAVGLRAGFLNIANFFDQTQLLIDPNSGQYLGARQVTEHDDGPVPAGTVTSLSSVHPDVAVPESTWQPASGEAVFMYP